MPPIVAIALALLTKEVYLSLFAGCALGALLAAEFHPWIAFDTLFNTMIDSVDFSILMFPKKNSWQSPPPDSGRRSGGRSRS